MIQLGKRSECCGCTACASVCPRGAIVMKADGMGFMYPSVNPDLCIGCGKCEQVCGFANAPSLVSPMVDAVAMRHYDSAEVLTSRSGAAFVALSDVVLSRGGSVYGAAFDADFSVHHRRAVTAAERDAFKGSKYVQSRMEGTFGDVLADLRSGREVLFSGTSCQVAGLKAFIGDRKGADGRPLSSRLVLVDVLCHGAPAPAVWKAYLGYRSARAGSAVTSADFRDKKRWGWKAHRETVGFADGSFVSSRSFTDLFYKHIMLRPSCGECPFNSLQRVSDITLADFWGWEKTDPALNADDLGYSLLLISSDKGLRLLEECRFVVAMRPVDIDTCMQRPLRERVTFSPLSDAFERDFLKLVASPSGAVGSGAAASLGAACSAGADGSVAPAGAVGSGFASLLRRYGDLNFSSQLRYLRRWARQFLRRLLGRV